MAHIFEQIEAARQFIVARTEIKPAAGLILGSGLGHLADGVTDAVALPYAEIPFFPTTSVPGHRGELVIGRLADRPVAIMRGRFHFYEGYGADQITFPVRVMHALGADTLIVTNAAGGLRPDWQVGDLMVIADHINFVAMTGDNPLRGPNDDRLGTRFPALTHAYDAGLAEQLRGVAGPLGLPLRSGVYAQVAGPSFETPAELRLLQRVGADAVGMSTASEVIVAVHSGMRVLGISMISNIATPDAPPANHAEVLAAGEAVKERFGRLLLDFLSTLAPRPQLS